MNPQQRNGNGNRPSQFGETNIWGSKSRPMSGQFGEPTPKKPKLDVAKHGNITMPSNGPSATKCNGGNNNDVGLWGDEFDFDEDVIAKVDEDILLTQMSFMSQNSNVSTVAQTNRNVLKDEAPHIGPKNTVTSVVNKPATPLRRTGSSQWPQSSFRLDVKKPPAVPLRRIGSSHYPQSSIVNGGAIHPSEDGKLEEEIKRMKGEIARMKEELNKKTGEAIILRDKVNSYDREKDKIRREYSSKIETLKAEAERNSNCLVKEIRSLRGQLDVKNMELKTAERKMVMSSVNRLQPDSPSRPGAFSRSLQRDSSPERELTRSMINLKIQSLPLEFLRDSVLPELLEPSQPEAPMVEYAHAGDPRLFSGSLGSEGGSGSKNRTPAARRESTSSHTYISTCPSLLLSPRLVDITSEFAQQTISKLVDMCHKILQELMKQLESTTCSSVRLMERERELLWAGSHQLPLDRDYDLVSHRELYRDERGISARRALGLLSLLLQRSNFTANKILSSSKGSTDVLETVKNIVQHIEKQRRTLKFQGVLAGSVALIENLLKSETNISKENQLQVVDILRTVVSARPGSLVVQYILQTLVTAATFPHITDSLCHNSGEKTYKENTRVSIIQFTPDSCVVQVLCGLVKAVDTPRKYVLTEALTRWVLLLFCDTRGPPRWLTAAPTDKSCQCHSLLCRLCFSLLSETCFTYPAVDDADRQLVERLLARRILLINIFMNENEHLLKIADPLSLGCYEHFLWFMSEAKIPLDSLMNEFLAFLCTQEDMQKPALTSTIKEKPTQIQTAINFYKRRDNEQNTPDILKYLDTL